jgi:hypothetical protein
LANDERPNDQGRIFMTAFFSWLSKALSESAEPFPPSLSRLLTFLFGLAAIGWVSYLVHASKALPSLLELAGFVSSPYIVNKTAATASSVADTIVAFKNKPADPAKP